MRQAPTASDEPLGLRLRIARIRAGRNQYEVAAAVGVSGTVLSQIELGRKEPSPELLERLERELERIS